MSVGKKGKIKEVLQYLQAGNTLTVEQAYHLFDTMRLPAIIYDLREAGYSIHARVIKTDTDRYTEYYM